MLHTAPSGFTPPSPRPGGGGGRAAQGERQPTGAYAFDRVCTDNRIEHRLTKPRTPQTNGMIERFNGRIADVLATTRFDSTEHLTDTIKRYVQVYNQHISQKALGLIPLQAMRNWYQKQSNLFKKRAYNLAGLDRWVQNHTVQLNPGACLKVSGC